MTAYRSFALCLAIVTSDAAIAADPIEDIHVLRSIREARPAEPGWCAASRTGFAPLAEDSDRFFHFWTIRLGAQDGRVDRAGSRSVGEIRACFGATTEPARQNFYGEIRLDEVRFKGRGECLALQIDTPERGLFPVRCHLVLEDLPALCVGGILTTNTFTSRARYGGDSDPPGYTQASIATVRLWRAR